MNIMNLYNIAVELIGVVPTGFEFIYAIVCLFLVFLVLLPFIFSIKILWTLLS